MELLIILLGIVLGLVFAFLKSAAGDRDTPAVSTYYRYSKNARGYFRDSVVDRWGLLEQRDESLPVRANAEQQLPPSRRPDPVRQDPSEYRSAPPTWRVERRENAYWQERSTDSLPISNENNDTKALIDRWRRSIVGLIKMADRNSQASRQFLTNKDYSAAVQAAYAGIENVSRALIHCYGDKPELEPGQEESLKLLSLKIKDAEKEGFEKIIGEVVAIRKHIANRQIQEAAARSIVESTSSVIELFKQMIREKCMMEIPELKIACPKCASIDVSTWHFNENVATQQCDICRYKWLIDRYPETKNGGE